LEFDGTVLACEMAVARPLALRTGQQGVLSRFKTGIGTARIRVARAVARANVLLVLAQIRRRSPKLAALEEKGSIKLTGGMYNLANGVAEFLGD